MINKEDEKYQDVINSLKGLQKVKAPANFETNLMRRINSLEPEKKESFWERFLMPSKLVPAAALAVSAVILLFVFNTNGNNDDPLLTNPRIRTDIISTDDISRVELSSGNSNKENLPKQKSNPDSDQRKTSLSSSVFEYSIDKKGLNFRQVNLSKEERESLSRVKSQFLKIKENSQNN